LLHVTACAAVKFFRQSCATPLHLPRFCLRLNRQLHQHPCHGKGIRYRQLTRKSLPPRVASAPDIDAIHCTIGIQLNQELFILIEEVGE
jgi:hypothetical protein